MFDNLQELKPLKFIFEEDCWKDIPKPEIITILGDSDTIQITTPPNIPDGVTLSLYYKLAGDENFWLIGSGFVKDQIITISFVQSCQHYLFTWQVD